MVLAFPGLFKCLNFPQNSHNPFSFLWLLFGVWWAWTWQFPGAAGPQDTGRDSRKPDDITVASAVGFLLQPMLENLGSGESSHPDYRGRDVL